MSWRRYNLRSSSGPRPLGRCSTQKPAPCSVVVIDEDEDDGDGSDSEVYIVDVVAAAGKAFPAMSRCQAKKGEGSSGNVINLDDDDDDDGDQEVSRGDKAGRGAAHGAGCPAATTVGRASSRNRYGLDCTSDGSGNDLPGGGDAESGSDEDSASDCEIIDDSCGTARKIWETAASSRKKMPNANGVRKDNEGTATASTSSSGSEMQPGESAPLDEEVFSFSHAADAKNCASSARGGPAGYNSSGTTDFTDAWKGEQSKTCGAKNGHGPSTVPDATEHMNGNVSDGKETECVQNSSGDAKDSDAECHINEELFQHFSRACKEPSGAAKDGCDPSSEPNANLCSNINVSNGKRPDSSASPTSDPDTTRNDKAAHFHNGAVPEKASDGIQSPHLDQTFVDSFISTKRVFAASSSTYWKDGSPPMSVSTTEKMDETIPEGVCLRKDQSLSDAHNFTSGRCSLSQEDLVDDPKLLGRFNLVPEASDFQGGLMGEREKHKETAEFKKAAEEEWASRQRQLQIQAEEARKLRKRKKAEAMRILDMEKKQKQRLEEVRESHKKNEEEIQLKEQYRCTIRKELEDTERRHRDTLSILRVLGIHVEGSEVRAALKQAQVKFHPDRVSRSDIYEQVKAEETFKLISRLKEKLPRFL